MNISRPRPVLTSAGIAGFITSVAGVLTFLGYNERAAHLSAMTTSLTSVIIGLVPLFSHLFAGLHAQGKVTPVADPRGGDGVTLVPVTKVKEAMQDFTTHAVPAKADPAPAADDAAGHDDADIADANAAALAAAGLPV